MQRVEIIFELTKFKGANVLMWCFFFSKTG